MILLGQVNACLLTPAGLSSSFSSSSAGLLQFIHEKGQKGGSLSFKFNLVDPEGNKLIDQSFFISVLGRVPSSLRCSRRSD